MLTPSRYMESPGRVSDAVSKYILDDWPDRPPTTPFGERLREIEKAVANRTEKQPEPVSDQDDD